MAIFNKSDQQTDYASNIATIAAGAHITGKIDIKCELHIDGEVDAEINSTGLVKIGRSGVVNTNNLRASRLIVSGKFSGEADCEAIEIIDGGEVHGKLTSASLEIDASSLFEGESIRKQPSISRKPMPVKKHQALNPNRHYSLTNWSKTKSYKQPLSAGEMAG